MLEHNQIILHRSLMGLIAVSMENKNAKTHTGQTKTGRKFFLPLKFASMK